jgi:hypothetical protein
MDDFGRRVGNSRTASLKRVSRCSDTENRNSGARGDCPLVPYPSLWTRHFFIFFELPCSLLKSRKTTLATNQQLGSSNLSGRAIFSMTYCIRTDHPISM